MGNLKMTDEICKDIKNKILVGELKENTKISERYLGNLYDTSRTTIRSAINKLKDDGWLYVQAKSGTYVSPVDTKAISDNFQVRLLLEPNMLLLAIPNITNEDILRLKKNCDSMENGDTEKYGYYEADNHNVIKEKTDNKVIVNIINDMMDNILRITSKTSLLDKRKEASINEWRKIIHYLELGDGYMASQYMTQHIINSSDTFKKNFHIDIDS
ncbi:GntR family transcriptional regulator [Anaeromicrobium sediminis]|nr:GntR family transcriptional regulator [Anaeromicrobium sediminis]